MPLVYLAIVLSRCKGSPHLLDMLSPVETHFHIFAPPECATDGSVALEQKYEDDFGCRQLCL